jgi:hypothetical protein
MANRRRFSATAPQAETDRAIAEAEAKTSLVGTALTLGGAYGLYLLGLQSNVITTLGAIATAGGVAYRLFGKPK